ncbi:TRAP transporter large permease [Marinivivus vitaminiproducens]|uniref:TRAP transporter large permease n=1 Tax=Marinivivus vitaminiproducens TaxID=3035935 RepID=UPI0027A97E79|nr:TRAP transporter large permease [Geminicoccaceae bacterium SCSIO 64248]
MGLLGFIVVFLILLAFGLPIAFVMLLSSTLYFLASGNPLFLRMIPEKMFAGIDVFVLLAIPFFLLAGEIMNKAKLTDRLFDFCNLLVGRIRGGLAQVNVVSSIMFSGVTGVALGDIASQGRMFIFAMERQGYDRPFSAAITAATALLGAIMPPSTMIIVYCAVTNVSVGAMFAAAVIPALMLGLFQMVQVQWIAWRKQYPKVEVEVTAWKLFTGFRDAFFAVAMPVILIRGIIVGWFTPTEAAAACVVYALFVSFFILRTLHIKDTWSILSVASMDTARLFFIISGAAAMSWVFAMENVPAVVQQLMSGVSTNVVVVVLVINLFFLFCGMWLDASISIILFSPIVAPLASAAGIHPVQLGIMLCMNCVLGNITPPVGNVLFAVANIAKIGIGPLTRAMLPYIVSGLLLVILIGLWPDLTLTLPRAFDLVRP